MFMLLLDALAEEKYILEVSLRFCMRFCNLKVQARTVQVEKGSFNHVKQKHFLPKFA